MLHIDVKTFENKFITAGFDDILLDANNSLINSEKHYISYKQTYIQNAVKNLENYKSLVEKITDLEECQLSKTSNSKVVYTYIDTDHLNELNQQAKDSLLQQRRLYDQFVNYIHHLNTNYQKISRDYNATQEPIQRPRGLFGRLFTDKDSRKSWKY